LLTKHPRNRVAGTQDEPGNLPGGLLIQAGEDEDGNQVTVTLPCFPRMPTAVSAGNHPADGLRSPPWSML